MHDSSYEYFCLDFSHRIETNRNILCDVMYVICNVPNKMLTVFVNQCCFAQLYRKPAQTAPLSTSNWFYLQLMFLVFVFAMSNGPAVYLFPFFFCCQNCYFARAHTYTQKLRWSLLFFFFFWFRWSILDGQPMIAVKCTFCFSNSNAWIMVVLLKWCQLLSNASH